MTGAATQPRRLAVLALLVVAGERGMPREQILRCLWPDTDEERGRHALTQTLYALRHDLESDQLFLGQQELRLNPQTITSDYAAFQDALQAHDAGRAVASYGGPFLQGFHLPRADNFERWVDEQRGVLASEYGRMLDAAARAAVTRRDYGAAAAFLRRRAALDPFNGRVAVELMEVLAADGAVVDALQHARSHALVLRDEMGMPPDPLVVAAADRLREAARAASVTSAANAVGAQSIRQAPAAAEDVNVAIVDDKPSLPARRRGRALMLSGAVALALGFGLVVGVFRRGRSLPPPRVEPVLAVGAIIDYSGTPPGAPGPPLADMLAINLARGRGYRVISNTRMLELAHQLQGSVDSANITAAAARQAGAGELIDGALYTIAPNRYRLDLRRVDLATGALLRAYRVEGHDLFQLVDSCVIGLVPDLGGTPPEGSLARVSTNSLVAYQFYEEGLRRLHDGDMATAERRFRDALDADTAFAQAAYYYAVANTSGSRSVTIDRLQRAVQLSRHASDRERLVIQAEWAAQNTSPTLRAFADTLMIRYPEEVDGYYFAGIAANMLGDYARAVTPLRRVLSLDSLGARSAVMGRCRRCEAYSGLGHSYGAIDSQVQLAALVHEWVDRQPDEAQAWRTLASLYAQQYKRDSALGALRVADSLEPNNPWNRRYLISVTAVLEQYPEAEQLIRTEMEAAPFRYGAQGKWDLAVVLRQMGRLHEALQMTQRHRVEVKERVRRGTAPYDALHEGQVLFELGRFGAAAALFDSIARGGASSPEPALRARDQVWAWAHEADARAELRDTTRLRVLADTMEFLGHDLSQASYQRLHAHVRGLLARVQGRDAEAANWFRQAIVSPVLGFTRSNYELGAAYLRLRRPVDAIAILRPATRGGTDGGTLYVTRTEVQARLAEAFDAAGQVDSARYYYGKVLRLWQRADPEFDSRREQMSAALVRLGGAPVN